MSARPPPESSWAGRIEELERETARLTAELRVADAAAMAARKHIRELEQALFAVLEAKWLGQAVDIAKAALEDA